MEYGYPIPVREFCEVSAYRRQAAMSSDDFLTHATGQTRATGFCPHDEVSIDLARIKVFRGGSDHQFYKQEVDDHRTCLRMDMQQISVASSRTLDRCRSLQYFIHCHLLIQMLTG